MDHIRIDTPESVDLAMEPAGLGSRFIAALLDALIQYAVLFLFYLVGMPIAIAAISREGSWSETTGFLIIAILLVGTGLLFFLYKLLLEAFWNGQTVGKRVIGIRVVQANGMPAGFLTIAIRNLLRIVDYLPGYYIVGAVCVLATNKKQRLGDMAAGTIVVRDRPAGAPLIPVGHLSHSPTTDLNRLHEYVIRLPEGDLVAARGYWARRHEMAPQTRPRVALQIAQGLAAAMGWPDPLPPYPDDFIEEVLFVRAR